jgi:dolichol-phosphate mannosyltransferase
MNTCLYIIHVLLYCAKVRKARSAILIKFIIVGTVGFLVNSILLFLIYDTQVIGFLPPQKTAGYIGLWLHPDVRLFVASIVSVEAAIFSNFIFHENWTFKYREKHGKQFTRLIQFNSTSIGSPLITIAAVNILTPYFGIYYLISNAIGVGFGMSWNWLWNSRVIWKN